MFGLLFSLLASLGVLVSSASSDWNHGWASASEMTFADTNNPNVYSPSEIDFVAAHYKVFSMEKCTGVQSGLKTEDAIYKTAQQLKAKNPAIKIFFYLATDQQGIQCYRANKTFFENPQWWLRDDFNNVVMSNGHPVLDCTIQEARDWYTSIPLLGDGNGTYNGIPTSQLVDGVLSDSGGWSYFANISTSRLEALADAKFDMMKQLQDILTAANGGLVMANGISMYGGVHADPRWPGDHNVHALKFTNAIMNEHSAVFESVSSVNASFNLDTVSQDLDAIVRASQMANGTKVVFVQTWPGLYVSTQFSPSKTGPAKVYPPGGEPTPQNNSQWRNALREHYNFAQALFLSVAEANTFWFYGGYWYSSTTGYLPCPDDLDSCPAPPEWYPDLDKPLGKPLGSRIEVAPYTWTRKFEHASLRLDLNNPNASKVTFHPP